MKIVEPVVRIISKPEINWDEIEAHLVGDVGAADGGRWTWDREENGSADSESLIEFAGRKCYRSYGVGLNPNIKKVREHQDEYLNNLIRSGHGSVLEHANYTLVLHNVSRVLTHELVRHRAGTAYSQESLRYVRLTEIPMWLPEWVKEDPDAMTKVVELVEQMEEFQAWGAEHWGLDSPGTEFRTKKEVTSFMRRLAPEGLATSVVMTANVRAIRHIIEMRTAKGAEEEIREVAGKIGKLMAWEAPQLFGDYLVNDGEWLSDNKKV
jgi:thymidylate synthase (FAD)